MGGASLQFTTVHDHPPTFDLSTHQKLSETGGSKFTASGPHNQLQAPHLGWVRAPSHDHRELCSVTI